MVADGPGIFDLYFATLAYAVVKIGKINADRNMIINCFEVGIGVMDIQPLRY